MSDYHNPPKQDPVPASLRAIILSLKIILVGGVAIMIWSQL